MGPLITARGLRRSYGDLVALHGLDLTVRTGDVVALLGHNGSGKTTALRCIAGDIVPTFGEVRVAGGRPASRTGS